MGFLSTIFAFIVGFILALLVAIFGFFGLVVPGLESEIAESPSPAAESGEWTEYSVPILVDAAWLEIELASNPDLIVIDLASNADYQAGHIPGAVRIEPSSIDIAGTDEDGWAFDTESLLGEAGISNDSLVVVYDRNDLNATRLWWALTRLSHPDIAVLDGGLPAWEAAALPIELGASIEAPDPSTFFGFPKYSLVATTADVEAALDDSTTVIIDARSEAEYADGHVPGAINIPASTLYADDGTLLPYDDLLALFTTAGVFMDQDIIVYCASGVRASNVVFALNVLAYPSVQLYADSWPGWSSDPTRPVES